MGQKDLPLAAGSAHVKAFERAGWTAKKKRGKGKHFVLTKQGCPHAISLPDHREVKRVLLQKQIKLAGLTEEEYLDYFNKRKPRRG